MNDIDFETFQIFIIFELTMNPKCTVFETYEKFSGIVNCTYRVFEFLFFQFRNGNYDLEYKGCNDQLSLTHLTDDILGQIVDLLDFRAQMTLRNVCQKFKYLVDNCNIKCTMIELEFGQDLVIKKNRGENSKDPIFVMYTSIGNPASWKKRNRLSKMLARKYVWCERKIQYEKSEKVHHYNRSTYLEVMLQQFSAMIKSPKLVLETLKISGANFESTPFRTALKSLKHKVRVKNLVISVKRQKEIFSILTYLEAGVLENLEVNIEPVGSKNHLNLDKIAKIKQWKGLKSVRIEGFILSGFSVEHICTLEEFEGCMEKFDMQDLLRLKEKFLINPNFRSCDFHFSTPINILEAVKFLGPFRHLSDNRPHFQQHRIPGSDNFLEIDISEKNFGILKTDSESQGLPSLIRFL